MYLDDGCDELLHKAMSNESGPVVMEEVDDESLDVGAILVLICYDEQSAVAQAA